MTGVHFNLHTALLAWQFGPFPLLVLACCIAAGIWYLRADWALAVRGRKWKSGRTEAFFAGLVAIDLAFQSPVATLTASYFEAHVLQHLLLMIIAPALLAMGAPMTLILQTSGRRAKTSWLRILHSNGFAVLSHPIVVWFLYYGVMLAFFLTPLIGFAMGHTWLMDLINVGFLLGGSLFWWPMIGLDPIPRWNVNYPLRLVNLLIGVPLESFLAIALLSSRRPIAPIYSLASTHSGAGVLWVLSELFTVAAVIPIYFQWMAAEDRKSAREDARLDAEAARSESGANHTSGASPAQGGKVGWADFRPSARWTGTSWQK
jgi:cytochrome c oxidase assembly factor CtaG